MTDDQELLREYAKTGSEKAIGELVSRHLPLVFSAALRQVGGDHELAEDVDQNVFIDLVRKARPVRADYPTTEAFIQAAKAFSEADRRFWTSVQGRALELSRRTYSTFCKEDGSFCIGSVPPGTYDLKIESVQPPTNSAGPSQGPLGVPPVVLLAKEVVVPEAPSGHENDAVNLGQWGIDLRSDTSGQ